MREGQSQYSNKRRRARGWWARMRGPECEDPNQAKNRRAEVNVKGKLVAEAAASSRGKKAGKGRQWAGCPNMYKIIDHLWHARRMKPRLVLSLSLSSLLFSFLFSLRFGSVRFWFGSVLQLWLQVGLAACLLLLPATAGSWARAVSTALLSVLFRRSFVSWRVRASVRPVRQRPV